MLTTTDIEVVDIANDTKEIHFIKMHHMGQQLFYNKVEQEVNVYKKKGYVLFYEWIDCDEADDLALRKIKTLLGFVPSKEGYQQMLTQLNVDDVVVQDNEQFLNLINGQDYNVDISLEEIIRLFEERFGTIELTEQDLASPLYGEIRKQQIDKRLFEITLDYRNEYLAQYIQQSAHAKIIVLYGADHYSGVLSNLQKRDATWQAIDN